MSTAMSSKSVRPSRTTPPNHWAQCQGAADLLAGIMGALMALTMLR